MSVRLELLEFSLLFGIICYDIDNSWHGVHQVVQHGAKQQVSTMLQ